MAPRRSPKSGSPAPGARREAKHGGNKSAKKEGVSGTSFFTWFMVIALLGVWTSVAVVWFELVDYEEVLGKLGIYDADGDGDFDMEDAKVLLGLKERSVPEQSMPRSAEEVIQPAEKPHVKTEHIHVKTEPEDEIEALLHEVLDSQLGEIDEEKVEIEKDEIDEDDEETDFQEEEEKEDNNEVFEEPTIEQSHDKEIEDKIPEILEKSSSTQKEPTSHYQPKDQEEYDTDVVNDYSHVEEGTNEPEIPESGPENTEQPDHLEEEELEREDFTENTETIDHPEEIHERDTDVSDPVTEPVQSVHKAEHTEDHVAAQQHDTVHEAEHVEDHVAAQQHDTEVPIHTEDYTEDDVIDT